MRSEPLRRSVVVFALAMLGIFGAALPVVAQVATGNVAGTVKDAQGGVIPGATVTLISQTRGTRIEAATNPNGDFVFVNVPGDTYTVRVTMDGFKTLERRDVPVSAGDRVALGTLSHRTRRAVGDRHGLRRGAADPGAKRRAVVHGRNRSDCRTCRCPIATGRPLSRLRARRRLARRGSAAAATTTSSSTASSTMDTGSNGQMLQLNTDAIAEVKVVTQGYSAEYGRASGLQISAITKSGSNQFRGSVFDTQTRF